MISQFRSKNIMISDFWAKKLPDSGMTRFSSKRIRWKKVIPLRFYSKPLLITDFGANLYPITDFYA